MKVENFIFADYCNRIGYSGNATANLETLTALMRCQLFTVPFENLDVQAGKVVSIEPTEIVNKIVYKPRGGYCYEVNSLFAMALTALDIDYYFVGARPMFYPARRPKTHMVIIATIKGEQYLCDLGFGSYGIRAPIPLNKINQTIQQDDDFYKLFCEDGKNYIVQALVDSEWINQFGFDLYPHELLDFMPANYYNSKNPDAIFVKQLLIVKYNPLGRKILSGTRLKKIENGKTYFEDITNEQLPDVLKNEFGLIAS
ncbi:MAG: arylamine N-acetyltransferase [Gammaproteobacteria bacterium]|nr:MAG: arylamine N-acetyltransferase [Gammaproteobacteria bacterium]